MNSKPEAPPISIGESYEVQLKQYHMKGESPPGELIHEIVEHFSTRIREIVFRLAKRLPSYIDVDDLHNEGVLGFIDALKRYDGKVRLFTYAEFRIKGQVLDCLRDMDWAPRSIRKKARRFNEVKKNVEQMLGRVATEQELADALGISLERYNELETETAIHKEISIDTLSVEGVDNHNGGYEFIPDRNAITPLEIIENQNSQKYLEDAVKTAINKLSASERMAVSLYWYSGLTESQISVVMGVTESRVCQIMRKASKALSRSLKHIENF